MKSTGMRKLEYSPKDIPADDHEDACFGCAQLSHSESRRRTLSEKHRNFFHLNLFKVIISGILMKFGVWLVRMLQYANVVESASSIQRVTLIVNDNQRNYFTRFKFISKHEECFHNIMRITLVFFLLA